MTFSQKRLRDNDMAATIDLIKKSKWKAKPLPSLPTPVAPVGEGGGSASEGVGAGSAVVGEGAGSVSERASSDIKENVNLEGANVVSGYFAHTKTHLCRHFFVYKYIRTHTNLHACTHTHKNTYTQAHNTHTHTHTQLHTYTHTNTHLHTH